MDEREPLTIKGLLDRLLAARARRDREERFSDPWRAADAELHAVERAIFAVPADRDERRRADQHPDASAAETRLRRRRPSLRTGPGGRMRPAARRAS